MSNVTCRIGSSLVGGLGERWIFRAQNMLSSVMAARWLARWCSLVLVPTCGCDETPAGSLKPAQYLSCQHADRDGFKCGFVWLDGFEETTLFESTGPFQTILLSRAADRYSLSRRFHHLRSSSRINRYGKNDLNFEFYNVLLLEWQGGIAERRGFGIVYADALDFSLTPDLICSEIFLA